MMKILLILSAVISFGSLAHAKDTGTLHAKCFPADKIDVWEKQYCFATTGADDEGSEVFKTCFDKIKYDIAIPRKRCPRVIWLKEKACQDDKSTGNTRKACLTDKNYLKKIKANPPYTGS